MTNQSCLVYPPQTVPCGEFGTCVAVFTLSFCQCQPGYSSIGDFSVQITNPCDINLNAVRALWACTLVGVLFAYAVSIWGLMSRRAAGILKWEAWRLWVVPYLVITQSTLLLAMIIGKFVDPAGWSVGVSIPMTVIHAFSALVAVTFLVIGLAGISRTAYSGDVRGKSTSDRLLMKVKMRRLESAIACFWFIAAVCAFIPCAIFVDADNVFWSAALHGCGFAGEMLILGSVVAPVQLGTVIERVSDSIKANASNTSNAKLTKVLRKLRLAKRMATIGFTVLSVAILLFVLWPFLVIKTSYALPMFYLLAEFSAGALIWVTTTTNALNFRRPSLALKRLSQALSSARKSIEKRTPSSDKRTSFEKSLLPLTVSAGPASPQF